MKFSDGPTAQTAIIIDADLDTVWAVVADIAAPTRFSTELQSADWLDDATAPAVGARFVGRNAHPLIGEWETTSVVTAYEPNSVFEWQVVGPDANSPISTWRFSAESTDDGQVELTQWCRMGPGPSGLTMAIAQQPDKEERIIELRMAEHFGNMQRNLDGFKQLIESAGATDRA